MFGHARSRRAHAAPGAATGPAHTSAADPAAWIAIALIAVVVAGAAGWAFGRLGGRDAGDMERTTAAAGRFGQLRGEAVGFRDGARLGRRESVVASKAQTARSSRERYAEGYGVGVTDGRQRAAIKAGELDGGIAAPSTGGGTYPVEGYEDVLGDDAPGFSDSGWNLGSDTSGSLASTSLPASAATEFGDEPDGLDWFSR